MKIKQGDTVIVIAGKNKGKTGKVMRVLEKSEQVKVEGVNMRTRHIRKTPSSPGRKVEFEGPIHASNVMLLDPKSGKPTRVGYRMLENGKKQRVAKRSGESVDQSAPKAAAKSKKK